MLGNPFTIGTLTNSGFFKLQGTQPQSITTMTMINGTVQYYGAANGTISLTTFFSLQILGPATFTLNAPITVGPITGGGTLTISGGILDVGANNMITIAGNRTIL